MSHHMIFDLFCRSKNEDVSVLQIGANDGKQSDFMYPRAMEFTFKCVLVEPHPLYMQQAKANYSTLRDTVFEEVAIGATREERELYYVDLDVPEHAWIKGMASFDRDHIAKVPLFQKAIASVPVQTVPLQDIVDRHDLHNVDVLIVDVEGWEKEVFSSVDFETFFPKLVIFEELNLSPEDCDTILALFPDTYLACKTGAECVLVRMDYAAPSFGSEMSSN